MNTKYTLAGLIVVFVLLGALYLASLPKNVDMNTEVMPPDTTTSIIPDATKPAPTATTPTPPTTKPPVATVASKLTGFNSINYLIALKTPNVCTIKAVSPNRTGTVYVAGGQMRGDLKSVMNGTTVDVSMISDGTNLFVWKPGAATGIRLSSALTASGSTIATNGGLDPSADISYSCAPWSAQTSQFNPPTSVVFSSIL